MSDVVDAVASGFVSRLVSDLVSEAWAWGEGNERGSEGGQHYYTPCVLFKAAFAALLMQAILNVALC